MTTTKKQKFVNAFTYKQPKGEVNELPSMTRPEMTMSLKTLLERYTRGGDVATFTPVYYGQGEFDEVPEFEKMDTVDKLAMAKSIRDDIQEYQNRHPQTNAPEEPIKPQTEPAKSAEDAGDKPAKQ